MQLITILVLVLVGVLIAIIGILLFSTLFVLTYYRYYRCFVMTMTIMIMMFSVAARKIV